MTTMTTASMTGDDLSLRRRRCQGPSSAAVAMSASRRWWTWAVSMLAPGPTWLKGHCREEGGREGRREGGKGEGHTRMLTQRSSENDPSLGLGYHCHSHQVHRVLTGKAVSPQSTRASSISSRVDDGEGTRVHFQRLIASMQLQTRGSPLYETGFLLGDSLAAGPTTSNQAIAMKTSMGQDLRQEAACRGLARARRRGSPDIKTFRR